MEGSYAVYLLAPTYIPAVVLTQPNDIVFGECVSYLISLIISTMGLHAHVYTTYQISYVPFRSNEYQAVEV